MECLDTPRRNASDPCKHDFDIRPPRKKITKKTGAGPKFQDGRSLNLRKIVLPTSIEIGSEANQNQTTETGKTYFPRTGLGDLIALLSKKHKCNLKRSPNQQQKKMKLYRNPY